MDADSKQTTNISINGLSIKTWYVISQILHYLIFFFFFFFVSYMYSLIIQCTVSFRMTTLYEIHTYQQVKPLFFYLPNDCLKFKKIYQYSTNIGASGIFCILCLYVSKCPCVLGCSMTRW